MTPYADHCQRTRVVPGRRLRAAPGWQRMLVILSSITVIVTLLLALKPAPVARHAASVTDETPSQQTEAQGTSARGGVSSIFAPAVQHWAPQIVDWAARHELDPNIVATVMQIESCGDPAAVSIAGAQGLFQVMPYHFAPGEDSLDPDTNALRGLTYLAGRLQQTGGDIGRAFAGYNGGQRAAASSWDQWPAETQRYYVWSTGIYDEVNRGLEESPTLQRWLRAGGASLCRQAAQRLSIDP